MSLLSIDGLEVTAGATAILRGISLMIAHGSRHAIAGPNGAGKSTLLHTIAGNIRPSAGQIRLSGADITGLAPHHVARKGVARTWQHPSLVGRLSVAANIEMALDKRIRKQSTAQILAEHGLARHAATPVHKLPYGLQRRAELAAALAADPILLLLDEPTAGLSEREITALSDLLLRLPATTAVLIADHHEEFVASVAGTVHLLRGGQLLTAHQPSARAPAIRTPVSPARASGPAVLEVRQLTAGHEHRNVLTGLDLTAHEGDILVISGPNGSGKTTLLDAISGLQSVRPPTQILLRGNVLQPEPPSARARRGISYLPHNARVFTGLTVAENLAFAAPGWQHQPLAQLIGWRPRQRAATLSGGEQRLLALVTALSHRPQVVLLDEPFEGLSSASSAALHDALTELAGRGSAVVLTDSQAHRPLPPTTRRVHLRHPHDSFSYVGTE